MLHFVTYNDYVHLLTLFLPPFPLSLSSLSLSLLPLSLSSLSLSLLPLSLSLPLFLLFPMVAWSRGASNEHGQQR